MRNSGKARFVFAFVLIRVAVFSWMCLSHFHIRTHRSVKVCKEIHNHVYACANVCISAREHYCSSILGSHLISPWVMWQDEVTVCQKAGHGAVTAWADLCARALGIIRHSLPYQSITNNHSGCFLSGICPSGHQLWRWTDFFFLAAGVIISCPLSLPSPVMIATGKTMA